MAEDTSVVKAINNLKLYQSSPAMEATVRVMEALATGGISDETFNQTVQRIDSDINTLYNMEESTGDSLSTLSTSVNDFMTDATAAMDQMWDGSVSMQSAIAQIQDDTSDMFSELQSHTASLNNIDGEIAQMQSSDFAIQNAITDLEEGLATVASAQSSASARASTIESNVAGLTTRLGTAESSVSSIQSNVSSLQSASSTNASNIAALQGASTTTNSNVSALVTRANNVDTSLTTINGNVSALQTSSGSNTTAISTANANLLALRNSVSSLLGTTGAAYTLAGPVMIGNMGRMATQIGAADLTWAIGETKNAYQVGVDVATTGGYEVHRIRIIPSTGNAANYTQFNIICTPSGVVGVTRTFGDRYTADVSGGWVRITNADLLSARTGRLVRVREF